MIIRAEVDILTFDCAPKAHIMGKVKTLLNYVIAPMANDLEFSKDNISGVFLYLTNRKM